MDTAAEVFAEAELISKVKDPAVGGLSMIREDHVVFTFFPFASNSELTQAPGLVPRFIYST